MEVPELSTQNKGFVGVAIIVEPYATIEVTNDVEHYPNVVN